MESEPKFSKGMYNNGSICFMNSALQCLLAIPQFSGMIMGDKHFNYIKDNIKKPIITQLRNLFRRMVKKKRNAEGKFILDAKPILLLLAKRNKEFENCYEQQDSQEFIIQLLDAIHEEIKFEKPVEIDLKKCRDEEDKKKYELVKEYFKDYSLLKPVFGGIEMKSYYCETCKHKFYRGTNINQIQLNLTEKHKNLSDCFDDYFCKGFMEDYRCEKCEDKNVYGKSYLWKNPPNMIIHLVRFLNCEGYFKKIRNDITIPERINIENYTTDKSNNYELCGIIIHYGSLSNGHYISYTKKPFTNEWFRYDDEKVNYIGDYKNIDTDGSYILFYRNN
jgi:ubiquitin C-terminal hydrolase